MNAQLFSIALPALLLAWANGANDASKGVATLIGSGLAKPARMSPNQAVAFSPVLSVSLASTIATAAGASSPKARRKSSATLRASTTQRPASLAPLRNTHIMARPV